MRFLRTFFRHWYLYLIPIIVLPALLTVFGYQNLRAFSSSALLFVDKPVFLTADNFGWNPYLSAAQNEQSAMSQLMASETFVVSVAEQTKLSQKLDLTTRSGRDAAFGRVAPEVSILPTGTGPNTILLTVTDKDPVLAQQLAEALLSSFSTYYQQHRESLDLQGIKFYQSQLQSAQSQLSQDVLRLQQYMNAHPEDIGVNAATDPQLAALQQAVSQDQQQVNSINTQLAQLNQDLQANAPGSADLFRVLDPPLVPLAASTSKKKLFELYTGGGLAAALALVGAIVAVLTLLDKRIYSTQDLQPIGDDLGIELPIVETVPFIARIGSNGAEETDDSMEGVLLPVLTALPRLQPGHMRQQLRRAAGSSTAVLPASAEEEDEEDEEGEEDQP